MLSEMSNDFSMLQRHQAIRRPVSVLAALREIARHGADATHQAFLGTYQPHQGRAITACLKTAGKLRSLAPAAAALAAAREEENPEIGDAWERQWSRKEPSIGDDAASEEELMIEGSLWYLALTLRNLRRTLERSPSGGWMASGAELKLIAVAQNMATQSLGAIPMEAVVMANQHRRENRASQQPVQGPTMSKAKLAKVVPLSA